MKKIINLLLVLFFAILVHAITIENPLPTIITTFTEPVIVESVNATLKDSQNNIVPIENVFISPNNRTFKYRPLNYLQEGNYLFLIQAQDIYGNLGNLHTQSFTINVPPSSITLVNPSFGVSPTEIFDLIVKTSLPSECRYSLFENAEYENMAAMFETIDNILHTVASFDINNLPPSSPIYIACKTSYDNSISTETFLISVDTTPPTITSISANPITEIPIETTLQLVTDDPTVCAYSKENIPFSNMSFFFTSNETLFNSYTTSHNQILTSPELEDYNINTFYIICKNLAELFSETSTININVDTTADATITINYPQQYTFHPTSSVVLNITTNKLAVCYFSNNSENIFEGGGTFGGPSGVYYHISNPLFLTQGAHTYYFKCFIDPPEGPLPTVSTTFTIDTTPPTMLYVDDSNTVPGMQNLIEFTYYLNKLDVKWDAIDNESGIMKYEYSIWRDNGYAPADSIKEWTQIEQGDSEDTQECTNSCNDYKVDCNEVCNSEKLECEDICSDTIEECKNTCEEEESGEDENECKNTCDIEGTECDFGCGNIETNCDNSCNNEKDDCSEDCGSKRKTIKPLELEDKEKYYFIFKAQNRAGSWSLELSSNGITVDLALLSIGTCNNGVQDFDETDIDCGSLCDKCELNQSCNIAADCTTNYCNAFNVCDLLVAGPTCTDSLKNQDETDIDCGGNCPACTTGKACSINADCLSNHCDPDMRLCITYDTCANNILDINETDIDCGGSCIPCSNGNACILDSDCISNYCSSPTNICEAFTLCGNGVVDPGEQCENSTEGVTCSLFGFEGGTLNCGTDCLFDTSLCIGTNGTCGDNTINPGEQCEGSNLGNVKGCFDFDDFESGKLDCQDCTIRTNQCSKEIDPQQDTDRDGMTDVCELKYFKHRTRAKPNDDPDEDGLTNKEECKLCHGSGTNPKKEDTDGDGYKDNKEVEKGTDPCDSEDYPKSKLFPILLTIFIILTIFGGGGYYLYSRNIVSFLSKPPYIKLNADISFVTKPPFIIVKSTRLPQQLTPQIPKGPGIIEFIKTPPYIKLNADISFVTKPPFIIVKSTLPQPLQQQPARLPPGYRPVVRVSRLAPVRRQIAPRRKAPPVGLVTKKRQRRKVLDAFKTEKKEKKSDEDEKEE